MRRTLILNASYEPITTVTVKRAIILVLRERAEVVEADTKEFHSESLNVVIPKVIRLLEFVRIPFRAKSPLTRRGVLARDRYECCYCTRRKATTIDHVQPRSRGGQHRWENVVAACSPCNTKKDNKTPHEAGMEMRFTPSIPAGVTAFIVAIGIMDPTWEPYIQVA